MVSPPSLFLSLFVLVCVALKCKAINKIRTNGIAGAEILGKSSKDQANFYSLSATPHGSTLQVHLSVLVH